MQNEILDYFGKMHAQYIHARGQLATNVLITNLNCRPQEKILEIGFGTGTTLVQLYSNNRQTNFFGLEQSELMYRTAQSRLRFSLIGNAVKLKLIEQKNRIPFETNYFDKIFMESVLAIQEGDDLEIFLSEIQRVLKPNGILLMNETIWLDSTPLDEIHRINELCKNAFGIIQSNSNYPYLKNWKNLLTKLNFECEKIIKLDEVKDNPKTDFRNPYRLLSFLFTGFGKLSYLLNYSLRKERKIYFQKMKEIIPPNQSLMEGIIINASKKDHDYGISLGRI
jgi:ubiquinone/menaquinone biosynthesis C-methylase UbiE